MCSVPEHSKRECVVDHVVAFIDVNSFSKAIINVDNLCESEETTMKLYELVSLCV